MNIGLFVCVPSLLGTQCFQVFKQIKLILLKSLFLLSRIDIVELVDTNKDWQGGQNTQGALTDERKGGAPSRKRCGH